MRFAVSIVMTDKPGGPEKLARAAEERELRRSSSESTCLFRCRVADAGPGRGHPRRVPSNSRSMNH
jgi:hypothetical protein